MTKATQPYHGSLNLAVCIHSQRHYDFWNTSLDMNLEPGGVGEDITLDTWDDRNICVGDILCIGTAQIQISAPRLPCENQARFVGRTDWVKRTIKKLRTGMYARVLQPGIMQAGDRVNLEARPNHDLTNPGFECMLVPQLRCSTRRVFHGGRWLDGWLEERLSEKNKRTLTVTEIL